MRVVHKDGEILTDIDLLETAGHARARGYARHRCLQPDPGFYQGNDGAECVGDIERARQRHDSVGLHAAGADHAHRAAVSAQPDIDRPPVGSWVAVRGECGHGDGRGAREHSAIFVVDVHNPDARVGRREQPCLGREVIVDVGMKVQVILGQVGEDRHVV